MYGYIMQRTQISLTLEERAALDTVAARTGRSVSSLIRDAVDTVYGVGRNSEDDLASMRSAFGAWQDSAETGEQYVKRLRSGHRLNGPSS